MRYCPAGWASCRCTSEPGRPDTTRTPGRAPTPSAEASGGRLRRQGRTTAHARRRGGKRKMGGGHVERLMKTGCSLHLPDPPSPDGQDEGQAVGCPARTWVAFRVKANRVTMVYGAGCAVGGATNRTGPCVRRSFSVAPFVVPRLRARGHYASSDQSTICADINTSNSSSNSPVSRNFTNILDEFCFPHMKNTTKRMINTMSTINILKISHLLPLMLCRYLRSCSCALEIFVFACVPGPGTR